MYTGRQVFSQLMDFLPLQGKNIFEVKEKIEVSYRTGKGHIGNV